MSILNVEKLTHGFGERAIFNDVSFRLLKGEHIGLVGANGEGKSTFMNIVTGQLQPDEGKIEWSKNVKVGYLDQHTVLEKGMTVREVLRKAFDDLFVAEARMNELYMSMGDADESSMNAMLEEVGEIQERLDSHDFYILDAKIDEVARALGVVAFGMDSDVSELSGGQRTKILLAKLLLEKGADSQIKDNDGHKAIDYATANGLRDIITLLLKNENNDKISRSNINWYPGHMFKTKREIKEILRKYRCSSRSIRCKNTSSFKKSRFK